MVLLWFYQKNVSDWFSHVCNSSSSLFYISVSLATNSISFFFFSFLSLVIISQSIKWLIIDGILWGLWISFINLYSLMRFPWLRCIALCICTHKYMRMLQSYLCKKGNSSLVEAYKWNVIWLKNVCTGPKWGCIFILVHKKANLYDIFKFCCLCLAYLFVCLIVFTLLFNSNNQCDGRYLNQSFWVSLTLLWISTWKFSDMLFLWLNTNGSWICLF